MLLSESIDTNACVAANRVSSELRNILYIDYKTYKKSTRHLASYPSSSCMRIISPRKIFEFEYDAEKVVSLRRKDGS